MSSDDIEFESGTGEEMQDSADDSAVAKDNDQTPSTSQQALKQLNQLTNKVTASTVATTTVASTSTNNLPKIESKLAIPNAKIVYIKNSATGTPQTIRIGTSLISANQTSTNNSNSNASASTSSSIQKVQLLQLKNKAIVSSASASTASTNNTRLTVLKSGNAPAKFIISPSGTAAAKLSGGTPNTRTITVSQAQQMGFILPTNKSTTTNASTSTATKTLILPASSASTNIALKNQPTILNKGVKPVQSSQKILIQSADNSGTDNESKLRSPGGSSIVKMASTGQQVRVLQGKGLQYVRVVNTYPSGNNTTTTTTTANKIVNGRQQQVIVQRAAQVTAGGKPAFVTKKLEVMPIASTTKIIKKEPGSTQTVKTPTYLLNNVQKNIVTSSIDIKPVISSQSDSFEITETKEEPTSPTNKKFIYSLSTDRKSKSPEPNQSNLMYSTLKLPSPEPIEGSIYLTFI